MSAASRFALGALLGVAAAIGSWLLLVEIHPTFSRLAWTGIIAPLVAGLIGGVVAGVLVPRRKTQCAALIGLLLALPLLAFIVRHGLSHADRNPLLWYWPIWLVPAFALGGLLAEGPRRGA